MKKELFCVILLASCIAVATVPTDDFQTVAIWNMDAQDSGYVRDAGKMSGYIYDLQLTEDRIASGFTNQASITTGTSGVDGEALYFPGLSVARANPFWDASFDQITIDFWMKVESFPGATASNTAYLMTSSTVFGMYFSSSNRLNFTVYNNSNGHLNGSTPAMVILAGHDNKWLHVTAKFNKDTQETNLTVTDSVGTLIGSSTKLIGAALNAKATDIQIGGRIGLPAVRSFNGWLDNVKISCSSLLAPAYATPYSDGYGIFGLWHMNEYADKDGYDVVYDDDSEATVPRDNDMKPFASVIGSGVIPVIDTSVYVPYGSDPNFSNSMYFDGWVDSYLGVDTVDTDTKLGVPGDNFRYEAWVKLSQDAIDFYQDTTETNITFYAFRWYPNSLQVNFRRTRHSDGAASWQLLGRARFNDPQGVWLGDFDMVHPMTLGSVTNWNHIAVEYYDGQWKLLLNGATVRSMDVPADSTIRPGGRPLRIGENFWGWIDEARVSLANMTPPPCGYWGYTLGDLNKDCYVDIKDLAEMAAKWLGCTEPQESGCVRQPI